MSVALVVGGAGYIGSHMVDLLCRENHKVIVLDNLSTGFRSAVSDVEFIESDLADKKALTALFTENKINIVMHFASFIQVGESVIHPIKYYENNVLKTINLLNCMIEHRVMNFIFSSSAAVYGSPLYVPIDVKHPCNPVNPYGYSKYMIEIILKDYQKAYGLNFVSLRYFNTAGANPDGKIGERHRPETHLIPLVLQVASGRKESIQIYGDQYDTPDGTCIRDYIHVCDICHAHLLAMQKLVHDGGGIFYNLGTGKGYSILEVIEIVKQITGKPIKTHVTSKREGDPPKLIAEASTICRELKWQAEYPNLKDIIYHAWQWEQQLSSGSINVR